MDISKLGTRDLQSLLKRVAGEINRRAQLEKSRLLDEIEQLASKRGYSLKDLVGGTPGPAKSGKARRRKAVAVKYRHPEQPHLTWTGRGRRPNWVTRWLDEGKSLEALAVR